MFYKITENVFIWQKNTEYVSKKKFPSYDRDFWVKNHGFRDFKDKKHKAFSKSVIFASFLRVKREKRNPKNILSVLVSVSRSWNPCFLPQKNTRACVKNGKNHGIRDFFKKWYRIHDVPVTKSRYQNFLKICTDSVFFGFKKSHNPCFFFMILYRIRDVPVSESRKM